MGLALSFVFHIVVLWGIATPPVLLVVLLWFGAFALAILNALIAQPFLLDQESAFRTNWVLVRRMYGRDNRSDFVWRGCPVWMKRFVGGMWVYFMANFVFAAIRNSGHVLTSGNESTILSAGCMLMYAGTFSTLYSAMVVAMQDYELRCTAGHLALPTDGKYCTECRRPIERVPAH